MICQDCMAGQLAWQPGLAAEPFTALGSSHSWQTALSLGIRDGVESLDVRYAASTTQGGPLGVMIPSLWQEVQCASCLLL